MSVSESSRVTVEDIARYYPELGGPKGLQSVPDNQMIFFWAECADLDVAAKLTIGGGIAIRFIYGPDGENVGRVSPCREDIEEEVGENDARTTRRRFALLATRRYTSIPSEKILLMLHLRNGTWYRSEIAVVEEEGWASAGPKRELVGLG